MLLIPAIDLKDGQCVRLKQGDMAQSTTFGEDPAAMARSWVNKGARRLHLVDLNGAFAGHSANAEAIKSIRAATPCPIQLGGGIRDMAAVEGWLAAGITRVILGTAALTDPQFVKDAAKAFPGKIVVGADAKEGKIATQGWATVSELAPVDLGKRFEGAGVAAILFTDIDGDGLLKGVNVTATAALARALSIPVIASGGVGSITDIDNLLAAQEPNIEGVVVGRALYDGRIHVAEALRLTK